MRSLLAVKTIETNTRKVLRYTNMATIQMLQSTGLVLLILHPRLEASLLSIRAGRLKLVKNIPVFLRSLCSIIRIRITLR